jgi:uncharacterized protein DUF4339
MPTEWFYKVMGQECGPVSSAELKRLAQQGDISRDTFVRKGAEGEWVDTGRVKGLWDSTKQPVSTPAPKTDQETSTPTEEANFTEEPPPKTPSPTKLDAKEVGATTPTQCSSPAVESTERADRLSGADIQKLRQRGKKMRLLLGGVGAIVVLIGGILLVVFLMLPPSEQEARARFAKFVDMLEGEVEGEGGLTTLEEIDKLIQQTDNETGTPFFISASSIWLEKGDKGGIIEFMTVETDRDIDLSDTELSAVSDDERFLYEADYRLEGRRWVLARCAKFPQGSKGKPKGEYRLFKPEVQYRKFGTGGVQPSQEVEAFLRRSEEF